jgi:hypothetical protein
MGRQPNPDPRPLKPEKANYAGYVRFWIKHRFRLVKVYKEKEYGNV